MERKIIDQPKDPEPRHHFLTSSLPLFSSHRMVTKRLHGHTVIQTKDNKDNKDKLYTLSYHWSPSMVDLSVIEYRYPTSFVSNTDEISTRLQILLNDTLLDSARTFSVNIPKSQRSKRDPTKFIMDDFSQRKTELVKCSVDELYKLASPLAGFPKYLLPLACQLVHKRYGPMVASQLCDCCLSGLATSPGGPPKVSPLKGGYGCDKSLLRSLHFTKRDTKIKNWEVWHNCRTDRSSTYHGSMKM